jgi:hypothetical protein
MCKGSVVLLGSDVESLVTISSLLGCTGDMQQEPYQVRPEEWKKIYFINAVEADLKLSGRLQPAGLYRGHAAGALPGQGQSNGIKSFAYSALWTVLLNIPDNGILIPDPDFLSIPDPGSKNSKKRERRKKYVVLYLFFVPTNITKLKIILFLN